MRLLLFFLVPLTFVLAQPASIEKSAGAGYASITANDLSAHLHFLASDELEGRETTFRGQKVAARYIASYFQKLELRPIGDNGTYFQHFDVEVSRLSEQSTLSLVAKQATKSFSIRKAFLTSSMRDTIIEAPIVFVGFMDAALDSETEALIKGKFVLAFGGRKSDARDTAIAPSRRVTFNRFFTGAAGVLVIADSAGPGSLEKLTPRFSSALEKGSMKLIGTEGRRSAFSTPGIYYITPQVAEELIHGSDGIEQIKERIRNDEKFKPVLIQNASVRINSKLIKEIKQSENVIGLMEGSDPMLQEEVVFFTAHYDHEGIGGDGSIYHGADDDGSGTSAVLELAEAFATNPIKPKRSVVFLTVAGEEKGLLGSQYYVTHPIIPLGKTAADLNTDMIGRMDRKYEPLNNPNYTYVIGSDKISTQLDSLLKVANDESEHLLLDYTYNDENDPNRFYYRSDHYNFARNGVPVIFFFTGVHADYHQPTDTVDKILFDRMAKITRLIYYTGWKVANLDRPMMKNVVHTAQ